MATAGVKGLTTGRCVLVLCCVSRGARSDLIDWRPRTT